MANVLTASLHALAARTATGAGAAVDIGTLRTAARVVCSVAAISGTSPKIKPRLETSPDSSSWKTARPLGELTLAGVLNATIGGLQRYVRLAYDISGTDPSVTFSASLEAHVLYCEPADLTTDAVSPEALEGIAIELQLAACIKASEIADSFIGNAYTLPLRAWGGDVTAMCADIAVARLFRRRGSDPDGADNDIPEAAKEARAWFARLADGRLSPPGLLDSTPEAHEGGSVVLSRPARGWGR